MWASLSDLPDWAQKPREYDRKALVMGIGDYDVVPLPTPPYDVGLVRQALEPLGFKQSFLPNTRANVDVLRGAIDQFAATINEGDLALVYFSGHGVSRSGYSYLVPATAQPVSAQQAGYAYVSLDYVQEALFARRPGFVLIFLDACRTDPFVGRPLVDQASDDDASTTPVAIDDPAHNTAAIALTAADLSLGNESTPDPVDVADLPSPLPADPQAGMDKARCLAPSIFIAYAAENGKPARTLLPDEKPEQGSLYTRALSQNFTPNRSISWIVNRTRGVVNGWTVATGETQNPWISADICPVFSLSQTGSQDDELSDWIDTVRRTAAFQSQPNAAQAEFVELSAYLSNYPVGRFSSAAREKMKKPPTPAPEVRQLALVTDVLSGSVRSPSSFSASTELNEVVLTGQQNLYAGKDNIFSRVLGSGIANLAPGLPVKIKAFAGKNWALVETPSGQQGYLNNVRRHTLEDQPPLTVNFRGDEPGAPIGELDALRDLAIRAVKGGGAVVVQVGASGGDDEGLSRQTAYSRSLRISRELERAGLTANRITLISGERTATPINQARITLIKS